MIFIKEFIYIIISFINDPNQRVLKLIKLDTAISQGGCELVILVEVENIDGIIMNFNFDKKVAAWLTEVLVSYYFSCPC